MGLLTNQPKKLLYILLALELLLFLEDDDLFTDDGLFDVCLFTVLLDLLLLRFGATPLDLGELVLGFTLLGLGELVLGFTVLGLGELVLGFTELLFLGLGVFTELPLGLGELLLGFTLPLLFLGLGVLTVFP